LEVIQQDLHNLDKLA